MGSCRGPYTGTDDNVEIFISIHIMGKIQREARSCPHSRSMNTLKKRGLEIVPRSTVSRAELALEPMSVPGEIGHWETPQRAGSG